MKRLIFSNSFSFSLRPSRGVVRSIVLAFAFVFVSACGSGGSDGGSDPETNPPVNPPPSSSGTTIISGKASFELVPQSAANNSLDYDATIEAPIRGAVVELVDNAGAVLESAITDEAGDYEFSINEGTTVRIRVKAQMLQSDNASWDFQVIDNTSNGSLYALQTNAVTTAGDTMTIDTIADSGWGGSSYNTTRAAGPFAVLDSVYRSVQKVLTVNPNSQFPQLKLNWSPNNRPTQGEVSNGEIGTSFYRRAASGSEIFLLGAANNDTDEYDRHVVVHEWTHYIEDRFGRSDSLGGSHGGGDRLDPRVAFSEGLGYAVAGMVLDDPNTIDTLGQNQAAGFNINVEVNSVLNPGWYSEGSVQAILYDLYDDASDGVDNVSLGFTPIFSALTGSFSESVPLATIYSYIESLKQAQAGAASGINAVVQNQSMAAANTNAYGVNESNNAGNVNDVLPVYSDLPMDGSSVTLCSIGGNGQGQFGTYNKLSNRRFLKFNITGSPSMTITATGPADSDPDLLLHQRTLLQVAETEINGSESLSRSFAPGDYVLEVYEYTNTTNAPRGRTCFNISASIS